jgi:hypothetical protein
VDCGRLHLPLATFLRCSHILACCRPLSFWTFTNAEAWRPCGELMQTGLSETPSAAPSLP